MITMIVIVLIFAVLFFFDFIKNRTNIVSYGIAVPVFSLFLGTIISIAVGKFVPTEMKLVKTEILESIIIGENKQVFLLKTGHDSYVYFIKNKDQSQNNLFPPPSILVENILLEEKDIEYNEKDVRLKKVFKEVFKNEKLYWFFWATIKERSKLSLVSKDDILQ